MLHAPCPA